MSEYYEPSDPLRLPFECFVFRSEDATFPFAPHWHYFAEFLVCVSGKLIVTADGTRYILQPGDAFLAFPRVIHAFDSVDNQPVVFNCVKLDLNQLDDAPSYAPDIRDMVMDASAHQLCPYFSKEKVKKLALDTTLEECIREYREHVYGYDLAIRSRLYLIMLSMIRNWMEDGFSVQKKVYQSSLFTSIDNITSYIKTHLKENLRVEDLAKHCGMSYPNFAAKFRDLYGLSCKEYIEQVRITRAEHFLRFTDFDLAYISQEVGYSDCSHMIRDFKRRKGVTPSVWRRDESGN